MPLDIRPEDAARPEPTVGQMLGRGLRRRCPRCGSGGLFRTWWTVSERCPRCGIRFIREEGYFTGVYLVNSGAVLTVLFVVVMATTVYLSGHPGTSLVPFLALGLVLAVVVPVVFYPSARMIWAALDLAMTPMELDEILDAAEAGGANDVADADDAADVASDGPGEADRPGGRSEGPGAGDGGDADGDDGGADQE